MLASLVFLVLLLNFLDLVASDHVAIKGVQIGVNPLTGAAPPRKNLLTLQNEVPDFSLYIQALIAMENASPNDVISYFQIAGIHGRPYVSWDGEGTTSSSPWWPGYCVHDSVLFTTWHRPYLSLYEQTLFNYMQIIAQKYTGRTATTYRTAANNFRIPYWDWASTPAMPDIVNKPIVLITTPTGARNVTNPLYAYRFPYLDPKLFPKNQDAGLAAFATTVRSPDSNGNSQPNIANGQLLNGNFASQIYNLFTRGTTFPNFATMSQSGSSLEAVHGAVHVFVGGHMQYLQYSAFDPIFWLHHANVDRIFALWQAAYPTEWFPASGVNNPIGTFALPIGSTDTPSTPLSPFSKDTAGTLYTSTSSRTLTPFGYTYPEIQDWDQSTSTNLSTHIMKHINTLYGPQGSSPTSKRKRWTRPEHVSSANGASKRGSQVTKEWFVNIAVDKMDVDASFTVKVFLGTPPSDPKTWAKAANLAGILAVFLPPMVEGGTRPEKMMAYGEVVLRDGLEKMGIRDFRSEAMIPYLKKNLVWRIQSFDGTVIDNARIPSLKVTVQAEDMIPAKTSGSFPTYGNGKVHLEITNGKAGGASAAY